MLKIMKTLAKAMKKPLDWNKKMVKAQKIRRRMEKEKKDKTFLKKLKMSHAKLLRIASSGLSMPPPLPAPALPPPVENVLEVPAPALPALLGRIQMSGGGGIFWTGSNHGNTIGWEDIFCDRCHALAGQKKCNLMPGSDGEVWFMRCFNYPEDKWALKLPGFRVKRHSGMQNPVSEIHSWVQINRWCCVSQSAFGVWQRPPQADL